MTVACRDVTQMDVTTVHSANTRPSKCIFTTIHHNPPIMVQRGTVYSPHCRAVKVDQKPFVRVEVKGVCKLKTKQKI